MKQHPDTVNPLAVSSVTLAASDLELLAGLAATASVHLGQSISKSQIMRALIRTHGRTGDQHDVHGEIMRELVAGRVWGTEPASRRFTRPSSSAAIKKSTATNDTAAPTTARRVHSRPDKSPVRAALFTTKKKA